VLFKNTEVGGIYLKEINSFDWVPFATGIQVSALAFKMVKYA
jgi:hypothetical protein